MNIPRIELPTRWIKILKDIWLNKTRSLLVILSIAVGVASVGMINAARQIIERDLYNAYAAGNPASLDVYVSPFQKELATSVSDLREVEIAEALRTVKVQVYRPAKDRWEDIQLTALPSFTARKVNQFTVESGSSVPGGREILLERQSANALGVQVGDQINIKMPDKRQYTLRVAGIIHDVYVMPFSLMSEATGYMRMETLQWMGEQPYYNQIRLVVADNKSDRAHVLAVGEEVRDRVIEPAGYTVYRMQIPGISSEPGQHWAHNQISGILLILQIMGIMGILLSAGLIINTITAIINQQLKQIGVLRAIGGVRAQLISMYLVNVIILSLLALVIAIPLGNLGSLGISLLASSFMNFDITNIVVPFNVILEQVAIGLVMPVLVALYPILGGTRISVYDAIYQNGIKNEEAHNWVDRLLLKMQVLSPPVLLSLRNTFRKKTRLAFTLVTLTLAGAMFISVFSTRTSLDEMIMQRQRYVAFDASLGMDGHAHLQTAMREAMRIPGVTVAEGWVYDNGVIIHPDGSESKAIDVIGLPFNSKTIDPVLLDGRWLEAKDAQQVVINEDMLETEPDLHIGSRIQLKVGGIKHWLSIAGVTTKNMSGPRVYMTPDEFARITGRQNQLDEIRVRYSASAISTPVAQSSLGTQLETYFDNAGLSKQKSTTQSSIFADLSKPFDIILMILVIMASVLTVVGGLGLTGVMGLNVLERTREIGVLRAIGATNSSVVQVVVIEGVVVGLISWVLGAVVSVPSGLALAAAVISAVMRSNVTYQYSYIGLFLWLVIIVLIGVFSSLAPAHNAARLTVREVLEYE